MQINSVNNVNFGLKFSDSAQKLFDETKKEAGYKLSVPLEKTETGIKSMYPDSYTIDVFKNDCGERGIVLIDRQKRIHPLCFIGDDKYLDDFYLNAIIYSLNSTKKIIRTLNKKD